MHDEISGDHSEETSHPDIDSALDAYLGSDDFSYKTREVDGLVEHLVMKLKKGQWKIHFRIKDEEVRSFDNEEKVTFLIHQVLMDRALKRRYIGLFVLFILVAIPVMLYSTIYLGVGAHDDFEKFLIVGGLIAAFIPVFCISMSSAERSVDRRVYNSRSNFVEVLQKMIDLKEEPYQKQALEQRLQRLESYTRTTE